MKKILIYLILIFSPPVFAMGDTPPIPIPGGEIPIGGYDKYLNVSTNMIPEGAIFNITCDIVNPNYQKQYPIVLKIQVDSYSQYTQPQMKFNGQIVGRSVGQVLLNQLINKLEVDGYTRQDPYPSDILFYNFDNSDTAIVQNCIATYQTQ